VLASKHIEAEDTDVAVAPRLLHSLATETQSCDSKLVPYAGHVFIIHNSPAFLISVRVPANTSDY
jgi:hypothetical protein